MDGNTGCCLNKSSKALANGVLKLHFLFKVACWHVSVHDPVYPLLQNRTKWDSWSVLNPTKVSFQHQIGMTCSQSNLKGNYLWFVFRKCLLGISMALTCKGQEPPMIPAWMATPVTTARSGSMEVLGSFPKYSLISLLIRGILVEPPTSTISSTSPFSRWPSAKTVSTGVRIFWKRSSLISSNTCRVMTVWKRTDVAPEPSPPELRFAWRCSGTLIVTLDWKVRLILADSTACLRWWMSSVRVGGIPNFCRTCSVVFCSNLWLKSWPPSLLFPAEKSTWNSVFSKRSEWHGFKWSGSSSSYKSDI